jgi:hypothetical protein
MMLQRFWCMFAQLKVRNLIWSMSLPSILLPDPQKPSVHPNSRLSLPVKILSGPDLLPNRQVNFLEIPQCPIACFDIRDTGAIVFK